MTNRLAASALIAPVLAAALLAASPARTSEIEDASAAADLRGSDVGGIDSADERRRARAAELQAIRRSIEVSERRQQSLSQEIDNLEDDRASLSAELIATVQRLRAAEAEIEAIEGRLAELHADEEGVRASLRERRATMAEVLMALQRMGRTPPPAILSRPEDALAAIRGSILAGAVLPEIREQADELGRVLSHLNEVSSAIETEHAALRERYAALGEEQARIDLLVAAKAAEREQTAAALSLEQTKAAELAGKAESLQSLIQSLEREVEAASAAAEQAKAAAGRTGPVSPDEAARRLADTSRIAPAVRFAEAKGTLAWPVSGEKLLGFGEPDAYGDKSQGLTLAARPGTSVVSPADGWVVYAGPFRSYGQVVILNAGDDYHIVLAGMERVSAALGQFVLAGEPIGVMGATRLASAGEIEHTSAQPTLYVEFRKDGAAIDSRPWWAQAEEGEVNG